MIWIRILIFKTEEAEAQGLGKDIIQAQSLKEESQERAEDEAACAREGSSMRCIP